MRRADLKILQGKTFVHVLRWQKEPVIYKAISAIQQSAPVRITANSHNLPDGWPVAVASVKGMTQINARSSQIDDLCEDDFHKATVIDGHVIELNSINAADFKPYQSGGCLMFYTPADLTGYKFRMQIKRRQGGELLLELTSENSRIAVDALRHVLTLTISDEDTAEIDWKRGVFDLEAESEDGIVTLLAFGNVSVVKEVTV